MKEIDENSKKLSEITSQIDEINSKYQEILYKNTENLKIIENLNAEKQLMELKHLEIMEKMQDNLEKMRSDQRTNSLNDRKFSSYDRNSMSNLKIIGTKTPLLDSLKEEKEGDARFVTGNRDEQVICKGCKMF